MEFLGIKGKTWMNIILAVFIVGLILYIIPPILFDLKYILSWTLILLSILFYAIVYYKTKDLFHPVGIFSLILIFTVGVANFNLSYIQSPWTGKTWLAIVCTYVSFLIGYFVMKWIQGKKRIPNISFDVKNKKSFLQYIYGLFIVCFLAYILEVFESGFQLPIFSNEQGSYKEFGIKFVHYLTVSLALVNYFITLYFFKYRKINKLLITIYIISFIAIVTLLSRQLLILLVLMTVISYHYIVKKIKIQQLSILLLGGLIAFTLLGNLRSNSGQYILIVAKMVEGVDSPLVGWLYSYIAINYENLNYYINHFTDMHYGAVSFFPLFAFTLTKQFVQVDVTQYYKDPNFTTSTMMYDFYLDFGLAGTIIFPVIIGALSYYLYNQLKEKKSIYTVTLYAMVAHNLFFVFFINFFANTSWVFYLGLVFLLILVTTDNRLLRTVQKR